MEILDEAQQDLVEGFQFYESREAGIGSYFWTVSSRTLIRCSFLLGSFSAAATPVGPTEPWNGEFYWNYGHGEDRSWEDAAQYGFICAGGGVWYTKTRNC